MKLERKKLLNSVATSLNFYFIIIKPIIIYYNIINKLKNWVCRNLFCKSLTLKFNSKYTRTELANIIRMCSMRPNFGIWSMYEYNSILEANVVNGEITLFFMTQSLKKNWFASLLRKKSTFCCLFGCDKQFIFSYS